MVTKNGDINPAAYYSDEIERNPILSVEEEKEVVLEYLKYKSGKKKGDARQKLIKANLRLVIKIAYSYKGLGLPVEDLISEGSIGLMRAVEKYDIKKKTRFSYYASLWIRQSITRSLSNKSKIIRIPHGLVNKCFKLKKDYKILEEELGREPTYEELAQKTKIPVKKIKKILNSSVPTVSINSSLPEDENCTLENIIQDTQNKDAATNLCEKENLKILRELLGKLPEREVYILSHRFGLGNRRKKTLEVIGNRLGLTRERIRQIERDSIIKVKKMFDKEHGPDVLF